jgi:hypothetical protein
MNVDRWTLVDSVKPVKSYLIQGSLRIRFFSFAKTSFQCSLMLITPPTLAIKSPGPSISKQGSIIEERVRNLEMTNYFFTWIFSTPNSDVKRVDRSEA